MSFGKIPPFTKGPVHFVQAMNKIIAGVNHVNRIIGDKFVRVSQTAGGITIGLNIDAVIARVAKMQKGGGTRKAFVKDDASTGNTIVCFLDTDTTGTEITVTCLIPDGTDLNASKPLLSDGDLITVISIGGTWYATGLFNDPSSISGNRKAYVKTDAGGGETIDVFLDTVDGTEVTVTCSIVNGSALNSAIPRLEDGDLIFVTSIGGTWYCTTVFQTSENCLCSS